jgi:hypothetical protein
VRSTPARENSKAATDDPVGVCLAAHAALAHLTDANRAKGRLNIALALADESGDPRLITLIQVFLAVAGLAAGRHEQVRTAVTDLDRVVDARTTLAHTLALADREGYQADADCVLVLAYAELIAGRFEPAAEQFGPPCTAGSTRPRTTCCIAPSSTGRCAPSLTQAA